MYNHVVEFMDKKNIISKNLFGFRQKHSTQLAISHWLTKLHHALIPVN